MSYDRVVFYIVAHQDDWALFGGEEAHADLRDPGAKVVLVHTTAGDAGQTDGWWEAREQGAIAAVRAAIPRHPVTTHVVQRNAHPLVQHRCANSVVVCLRLPDGSPRGTGFPATGGASLAKLRASNLPITAVDESTTYRTWQDLCDTLADILDQERRGISEAHPWIHAPDHADAINPGDHADHTATAEAVRSFAAGAYHRAWWSTYCTERRPANLSGHALARKREVFFAYGHEVERVTALAGSPVAPSTSEWSAWGDRSYARRAAWDAPDLEDPPAATVPGGAPRQEA